MTRLQELGKANDGECFQLDLFPQIAEPESLPRVSSACNSTSHAPHDGTNFSRDARLPRVKNERTSFDEMGIDNRYCA